MKITMIKTYIILVTLLTSTPISIKFYLVNEVFLSVNLQKFIPVMNINQ